MLRVKALILVSDKTRYSVSTVISLYLVYIVTSRYYKALKLFEKKIYILNQAKFLAENMAYPNGVIQNNLVKAQFTEGEISVTLT